MDPQQLLYLACAGLRDMDSSGEAGLLVVVLKGIHLAIGQNFS